MDYFCQTPLGEQLLDRLAQHAAATPMLRLAAHAVLGSTLFHQGEYADAWTHLEQCSALTDPTAQWALALRQGDAPGVGGLGPRGPHPVVPGLSSAGCAVEPGGAGPGADARPSL